MRTGFACAACLLLTAATAAAAQQTAPSDPKRFRTTIEAVEVDVRVVDERGNAVTGLTRDDFEIYERGVRQNVTTFTEVDVPFVAPRPQLEPDVQSNRQPFDGRLYVLVLDELHTHPLHASRVKHAVRRFLDRHFAANDRAAIAVTSGRTDASQELTASRRALLDAGVTSLQDELRLSQDSLRTLSDQTGGFAIVNANDLGPGFDRIVNDNTRYYLLGYQPTNQKRDGKFPWRCA